IVSASLRRRACFLRQLWQPCRDLAATTVDVATPVRHALLEFLLGNAAELARVLGEIFVDASVPERNRGILTPVFSRATALRKPFSCARCAHHDAELALGPYREVRRFDLGIPIVELARPFSDAIIINVNFRHFTPDSAPPTPSAGRRRR